MGVKKQKTREEIEKKYKWNIEAMIPDESVIEPALKDSTNAAESFRKKYQGHLGDSSETLAAAFASKDEIWRKLEKIYVYAHMRRDEDNSNSLYQGMTDRAMAIIAAVSAEMSFFTPELLACDENVIMGFVKENDSLRVYEFAIADTFREKKHILSESEEALLSQMGEITGATKDVFTMLNNADLKFGEIKGSDGEAIELTHGNYSVCMESHDRNVRKSAYESLYKSYREHINTISTAYNYNTKKNVVYSKIRKFDSSRAAALSGDNIPAEVYDNLVSVVSDNLPSLHRYVDLRKKLLGYDTLHMYDMYVPLVKLPDKTICFEDGLDIIREALNPLGKEYIEKMNSGIKQGWIDVYENAGKTSGAYSFGCYDSYPYILLNYTDKLNDVFTIVHEMGHSMHSTYTRENQPYIYGDHSIFTAEVASTVNESLLMHHLIDSENDPEMIKYLLNMHLDAFRTTLFRQTMFAEFEDMTHKQIESGQVLTGKWMSEQYAALNRKYYGDGVETDDIIKYEWARIPHFYNAFYVYKYATGYSAATAICDRIINNGKSAADEYIEFLKTGDSDYPIELLKIAGVDMSSPEPIHMAMKTFNELLDRFESLVK